MPSNYQQAISDLKLTPQERNLYEHHLSNLWGDGGVDNPDGSRSTVYQGVQEHDGKFYNVPTVWDGKKEVEPFTRPDGQTFDVPNATALQNVENKGWDTYPSYATPDEADQRYDAMHAYMDQDMSTYMNAMGPNSQM